MKDSKEYSTLYHLGKKTLLVHKDECHYSVVLEEDDAYSEIIVSRKSVDEAMCFPAADELTWDGRFKLLFGNYDGFEYFIKFCDDNSIETMTFTWPK